MLKIGLRLLTAALLPVMASAGVKLYQKNRRRPSYWTEQLLIGLLFGGMACLGTEFGTEFRGATLNCRDAAPLCAGIFFGGPAGIIAGIIGGVERWFAVYWGAGTYTRTACSIATIAAGFYAAGLRKWVFDQKNPNPLMALVSGMEIEFFHLMLVFVTHSDPVQAAQIVKNLAFSQVLLNGLSLMLCARVLPLCCGEPRLNLKKKGRKEGISEIIQRWLIFCIAIAMMSIIGYTLMIQSYMAERRSQSLLLNAIEDVRTDIQASFHEDILVSAKFIDWELKRGTDIHALTAVTNVTEINIVDENGIITNSTVPEYIGFDFHTDGQAGEFLCLLNGESYFEQEFAPFAQDSSVSRKYVGVALSGAGFIQLGFDEPGYRYFAEESVRWVALNRHVGENGWILSANEDHTIITGPENLIGTSSRDVANRYYTGSFDHEDGEIFEVTSAYPGYEGIYDAVSTHVKNVRVIALLPRSEVSYDRDIVVYTSLCMQVIAFALQFILIYRLIRKLVVENISAVADGLSRITAGNLDVRVDVRDSAEFDALSDDINTTVDTLKRYIREAEERIDAELEFARSIQHSALPNVFPPFPQRHDLDLYALMDTAKEVGGDFYDFFIAPDRNALYFLVADVSGKGIPAAMFMMRAKTLLRSLAESGMALDEVFNQANQQLCENNEEEMFVTSWMGRLDLDTGDLDYVNAGHNFPLLKQGSGRFEFLRCRPGLVLGGMEGMRYRLNHVVMCAGDTLYLYTDGVTEAADSRMQLYGDPRLECCLNELRVKNMQSLCEAVKGDVDAFTGEAPQADDITMLALRFCPKSSAVLHLDHAALSDIPKITEFAEGELERMDCSREVIMKTDVAVDEIAANIIRYAYPKHDGPLTVTVEEQQEPHGALLTFADRGIPYNPLTREEPDITLSADEREPGGLGILMIKRLTDEVSYEYREEQNILRVFLRLESVRFQTLN